MRKDREKRAPCGVGIWDRNSGSRFALEDHRSAQEISEGAWTRFYGRLNEERLQSGGPSCAPLSVAFGLAGAPGLEPGTYGFGDRRSTN